MTDDSLAKSLGSIARVDSRFSFSLFHLVAESKAEKSSPQTGPSSVWHVSLAMDLETENLLASMLLEEARRLQLDADREGVHAYLRKPNVRHRPNSRFLTATVRGVQQANRVVEVNDMWRAREKELELESKMKGRVRNHDDSRGEKRKYDLGNQGSSSRMDQERVNYSSYSEREDGLQDDEIENFLHSRVKRGRGAIGSRMDEPGPFLATSCHRGEEPSPDIRVEEKWERRVQGPEKPLFLKSKSLDNQWHRDASDEKPLSSEPPSKKEKKRETEQKDKKRDKKMKKDKKKSKHRHHHHRHKSRRD